MIPDLQFSLQDMNLICVLALRICIMVDYIFEYSEYFAIFV